MRFSVGLWDALFGEKVTCELPAPDGRIIKRQVTKKWLEKMQQAGEVKPIDEPLIRVHMLNPYGNTVEYWIIGKDIDQETVNQFLDAESGDIYAMTHFEEGVPQKSILKKEAWEKARQLMDSV